MLWLKWVSGIPDGFPQVLESGVALMISYVTFRRHTYFPGVVLSSSLGLSKLSPQTSLYKLKASVPGCGIVAAGKTISLCAGVAN